MALVKSAAAAVLSGKADGKSFSQERTECEGFRHSVIERPFAVRHFETLLQKLFHFRMNVESVGVTHNGVTDFRQLSLRYCSFNVERCIVASTLKCAPIARQAAHG